MNRRGFLRGFFAAVVAASSLPTYAAIVGTPAVVETGDTYTAESGSNRRVVLIGFVLKDSGTPGWTATFGGVSMTLDAQTVYYGDIKGLTFSLPEASIPSGSQTITVTNTSGSVLVQFYGGIMTLSGRDQTTAIESGFTSEANGTATGGSQNIVTSSLTNTTDADLLATFRIAPAGDFTARPTNWASAAVNNTSQRAHVEANTSPNAGATQTYQWTVFDENYVYLTVAYKAASAASALPKILQQQEH
jgi:hypothetical protein